MNIMFTEDKIKDRNDFTLAIKEYSTVFRVRLHKGEDELVHFMLVGVDDTELSEDTRYDARILTDTSYDEMSISEIIAALFGECNYAADSIVNLAI